MVWLIRIFVKSLKRYGFLEKVVEGREIRIFVKSWGLGFFLEWIGEL